MIRRPVNVPLLVKRIRQVKGMTQVGLARKLGVTFATVNSWENGKRLPQPYLLNGLLKLGKAIDVKDRKNRG
jgi:transcriptional regulator with XRE-family HTH domain